MINIKERIIKEAYYLIEHNATIRETAKHFHLSKTTIHKDLQQKLKNINQQLYQKTKKVLEEHLRTRHLKGGLSTKNKYGKKKNIPSNPKQ